jgi:[FeFe] hydrogenase H-cluster maturation GTPase HydF
MQKTPKSLRLHLGLFGRTNVGKSSLLNLIAGQDAAITSPVPGTTTDVVEKPMELLPLGPVVFLDTAGLDDSSELAGRRIERAHKALDRTDIIILVTEPDVWTAFEEDLIARAEDKKIPFVIAVNKVDRQEPSEDFLLRLNERSGGRLVLCSGLDTANREGVLAKFKKHWIELCPEECLNAPPLVGDLLPAGGLAVLVVPIDLGAPKGRLILPQVQTIRDALDNDAATLVVKEREYSAALMRLNTPPDLVVCDSQIVLKMVADTPAGVPCTTFSILFSRLKGDLPAMAAGVAAIDSLKHGDRVLVAEACSHHAMEDDIGRVKIPRWLRQFTGLNLEIEVSAGCDYPDDLKSFRLVVHCGSCMKTRRETLARIEAAKRAGVPVTNYGVCISYLQGVLERVLSPFPAALESYRAARQAGRLHHVHGR